MSSDSPGTTVPPYEVTLPVFEGPLDLLLHLIERERLDITLVSLAQVTSQYLDYLGSRVERDPDSMADFLVIAAKLLLIKSQVLIPGPPTGAAQDAEEEGQGLVEQLMEYKRFKEAAGWLRELETQGLQSYIRLAPIPTPDQELDLGSVTLDDLLAAVRRVLLSKPPAPSVNNAVPRITITVADQISLIRRLTSQSGPVSFLRVIGQTATRLEVIVTLLAVLEMVKQRLVTIRQDRAFGDIVIAQTQTGATQPPPEGE